MPSDSPLSFERNNTHCDKCDNQPCLFELFMVEFVCNDAWNAERLIVESETSNGEDINRFIRKRLYRNFAIWNGTIKYRKRFPSCVEAGVRNMYSSDVYMGFKRTHDEVDTSAIDIKGNKLHGVKWVKTDEGKYKVTKQDDVEEK